MDLCRICFSEEESFFDNFQQPCLCKGSMKNIHSSCLEDLIIFHSCYCTVCKTKYTYKFRDITFFFLIIIFSMFFVYTLSVAIILYEYM